MAAPASYKRVLTRTHSDDGTVHDILLPTSDSLLAAPPAQSHAAHKTVHNLIDFDEQPELPGNSSADAPGHSHGDPFQDLASSSAAAPPGLAPRLSSSGARGADAHCQGPGGPPCPWPAHGPPTSAADAAPMDDTDVFGLFDRPARPSRGACHPAGAGQAGGAAHHHSDPGTTLDCRPVLDFEEDDGAAATGRELVLYGIPLYKPATGSSLVDSLVFIPVVGFMEEQDYSGVAGKLQERLDKMSEAAQAQWQEMKEKEPGTLGHRIYQIGNRVVNDLTPEERMTRNIPRNVTKVIIYHPTQVSPEVIMERLQSSTSQHGLLSKAKVAVAGLVLPVAFGIDMILIPGPAVLTYWTSWLIYKNTVSAVGTARLTKYIAQDGADKAVRVNYAGELRLDPFMDIVAGCPDGVLDEETIETMVATLGEKELLEPLLELRARKLREATTRCQGGAQYTQLAQCE